jgi:hypothetical protein
MLKRIFIKKIIFGFLFLFAASNCLFAKSLSIESTPFKIVKNKLVVIADVFNFAYNCVQMDDGSIVYEVLTNSYATSGLMNVTVYCQQYKSTVAIPLTKDGEVIHTPITTYSVKFSDSVPLSCRDQTKLIVTKDPKLPDGYVLQLE